ncbi:Histidine kinase [Pedobacter sp. ok626]|uniref:sensor histidine kinase n=1 Tax=Pedobacter sp. ok626 TaxID=1761882 RepID=UPI0008838B0C|nr:histidine kinase [Pedobacter sp. ok626]SDL02293.1 Histidine kinase [Pedobacter sp. ok626]
MEKSRYKRLLNALVPLLLWLVVLSLPFFSRVANLPPEMRNGFLKSQLLTNSLLVVVFYVHTYFIYPVRERQYGTLIYIGLLLGCLGLFIVANNFLMPEMPRFARPHFPPPGMMPPGKNGQRFMPGPPISILPFAFVIMVSFCYRLYTDKQDRDRLIEERERIHLKTELEFLSSQISPHFMFNLLNTLVSMARKKSELLEPSLIRLSQLMRYMLYDNNAAQISLANEVEYLKNYINLQLLRFGDDVKINLYLSGAFERYTIAPMLLIPFVENAFKHGIGTLEDPIIDILLSIPEDKDELHLVVVNGIAPQGISAQESSSGIGLANVRRRLELLYPNHHLFIITQTSDTFTVKLQIDL